MAPSSDIPPITNAGPDPTTGPFVTHSREYPPGTDFSDPAVTAAAEAAALRDTFGAPKPNAADPNPSDGDRVGGDSEPATDDPDEDGASASGSTDPRNADPTGSTNHGSHQHTQSPEPDQPPIPLPERAWALHCRGISYTAIGRILGMNRETVSRHIKRIHAATQTERRADAALALTRALGSAYSIQAAAWEHLAEEIALERATTSVTPPNSSDPTPPPSETAHIRPYRAQRARLLSLALAATREVARLELLYDPTSPAHASDRVTPEPQALHLFIHSSPPAGEPNPAAPKPTAGPPSNPQSTSTTGTRYANYASYSPETGFQPGTADIPDPDIAPNASAAPNNHMPSQPPAPAALVPSPPPAVSDHALQAPVPAATPSPTGDDTAVDPVRPTEPLGFRPRPRSRATISPPRAPAPPVPLSTTVPPTMTAVNPFHPLTSSAPTVIAAASCGMLAPQPLTQCHPCHTELRAPFTAPARQMPSSPAVRHLRILSPNIPSATRKSPRRERRVLAKRHPQRSRCLPAQRSPTPASYSPRFPGASPRQAPSPQAARQIPKRTPSASALSRTSRAVPDACPPSTIPAFMPPRACAGHSWPLSPSAILAGSLDARQAIHPPHPPPTPRVAAR